MPVRKPISMHPDKSDRKPKPVLDGKISLQNVSFRYDDQSDPALKQITLEIAPGEVIAISGKKDSGKSTLLQLIAGILTPGTGTVTLDGVEPSYFVTGDLHNHIATYRNRRRFSAARSWRI